MYINCHSRARGNDANAGHRQKYFYSTQKKAAPMPTKTFRSVGVISAAANLQNRRFGRTPSPFKNIASHFMRRIPRRQARGKSTF